MKSGDVLLTFIPQADGRLKYRPIVLLREMPTYHDLLVCGVSTRLHQYVDGFDEIIRKKDVDFSESGLLADSLIRLGFLAVLQRRDIRGSIGAISPERHERLLRRLSRHLLSHLPSHQRG